jgi:hypothetical protein
VSEQLTSWWRRNPFLSGVHWTSGIELGIRLLSWVWLRRLLDAWPGTPGLFEGNPVFLRQLRDHQRFLVALPSHHSSANNHLIAEVAGLFAAACAFPYFEESESWRELAADTLRGEMAAQTFPCGTNREMASDYHLFVLELCLAAAVEGEAAGHSLGDDTWRLIGSMTDALAAMVDVRLRPPRQGDSDDAHGVLVDAPGYGRVGALLTCGRQLMAAAPWWPAHQANDVRSCYWGALVRPRPLVRTGAETLPGLLPGPGQTFLRAERGTENEIWCRCDHGPLGFLSTAAHGHADALSVEVRAGGVDVLADPGTYCYQGRAPWRSYFRSTRAHNTLELGGTSQSVDAGPFMWQRHVRAELLDVQGLASGDVAVWHAEHDGYARLTPPAVHRRRVELHRQARNLLITDRVDSTGSHECALSFHLGPTVECRLKGSMATLTWPVGDGSARALLALPAELEWEAVRGAEDPPVGWYSPGFDAKVPSTTLIGRGRLGQGQSVTTRLTFSDAVVGDKPLSDGGKQWT